MPFYRECRAYGRLKELQLERLAAKCHGYIELDKKHQEELGEWDEHGLCEIESSHISDEPLWGIVKEVEEATITKKPLPGKDPEDHDMELTINNITIPKMIRNLRKMHQVGIWVRDCHQGNWRNGRVIDFSSALTMPHPYMTREIMDEKVPFEESLIADGLSMDELVDWWNENHPREKDKIGIRMLSNWDYRLKTRTGTANPSYDEYPYRPEEYDWEAAERKRNESQNKENPEQDVGDKEANTKSGGVGAGKKKGKKKKGTASKSRRKRRTS